MSNEKPTLLDWLHLNKEPDYVRYQHLGALISALLFVVLLAIIAFGLITLILFFGALVGLGPFAGDGTGAAIRNLGLVLVALFGAPFLVWRSIVAQKQVNVAEQGQITDRINKAVEGLGSEKTIKEIIKTPRYRRGEDDWMRDLEGGLIPATRPDGTEINDREVLERSVPNLEVRIGAIYSLERIARDSLRDHIQIMEIMCAYIRENAPAKNLEPTEPAFKRAIPRIDIQAAISIIGRRSKQQIELEWRHKFRLDLRKANLSGVDFKSGNFSAAMFHYCRLEASEFRKSILQGTQFFGALLNFSDFFFADLRGTLFDHAIVNRPIPVRGGMTESINMGKIFGISVVGADLTAIDFLGDMKQMNLIFGSKDTKLSDELEFDRNEYRKLQIEIRRLKGNGEIEKAAEIETELYKNGFADWVTLTSDDMAIGYLYREFLSKLNLTGWPYQDN